MVIAGETRRVGYAAKLQDGASTEPAMVIAGEIEKIFRLREELHPLQRSRRW